MCSEKIQALPRLTRPQDTLIMKIKTLLSIIFFSVSVIILVLGIFGIVQINSLYTRSYDLGTKDAPLSDAAMEIKLTLTKGQLWLEQILEGRKDKSKITEVWQSFDESLWYCDAILTGGQNSEGTFKRVNNTMIENKIVLVKQDIETLLNRAHVLLQQDAMGQNHLTDEEVNLFNRAISRADEVEEMIHAEMAKHTQHLVELTQYGTWILTFSTLIGFLVASSLLYLIARHILLQVGGEPSEIARITQQVSQGNLTLPVHSQVSTGIYAAICVMVTHLKAITEERTQQDWIKTGLTLLDEQLRGEQEIDALAKNTIDFLATYLNKPVGLFYFLIEKPQGSYLQIIASYAYTQNDKFPTQYLIGEGLVGQVALTKQSICRLHAQQEYTPIIQSGLSQVIPSHVFLIPFLYEDQVKGVIEVGGSEGITEFQKEFLQRAMPVLGIAINTAQSQAKMQNLLQQSLSQTEELRNQAEELRMQQEELQQTNEELQSQSEELQTQQEELRQTNEELQDRARELEQQREETRKKNATLEKTQHIIEEKAKELAFASQYKSEFLANMSHELRTPLNSLLILSKLLGDNKENNLTEQQIKYAQTIYSAGSDLLALINDVLDLSKVEAGKFEIHQEEFSLIELVDTLKDQFQPLANEKGILLSTLLTNEIPATLCTDRQRLTQILSNLLGNAMKFTDQGGKVQLLIQRPTTKHLPYSLTASNTLVLKVIDTGIGIQKDKQRIIFEAFQQAEGSTNRRYGGTGLGLTISRQLIRLLGGEIEVDSEVGKGSTFTLYLPMTIDLVSKKETRIARSEFEQIPIEKKKTNRNFSQPSDKIIVESQTKNSPLKDWEDDRMHLHSHDKTLLIIEHDYNLVHALREVAQERNFKCLVSQEIQQGLSLAFEYKPDAIILDTELAKVDAVMQTLKEHPDTRHIPVHFISISEQQNIEAKKMGAVGCLLKPVGIAELGIVFKKIEHFIEGSIRYLLIVAESPTHCQEILDLAGSQQIQTTCVTNPIQAYQHLQEASVDCIILDVNGEQSSNLTLLEKLFWEETLCQIPIIIYAQRELTEQEEIILHQCEDGLPIKAVRSPERLLEEATLFLHQLEARLPKEKQNMLRRAHDKQAVFAGKKILIVDDDVRNTFALMTFLETKSMQVIVASHGKEALELLKIHPDVAIILMDIMMPEMDGYETIQKIRQQENFRKLPIIALTAKAMKGDKNKCIEAGANDYLAKPLDTDKLLSLMRVWLYA